MTDTLAMAGHSEYQQTPSGMEFPYDKVLVSGLVSSLRSNDSMYYSLSLDSIIIPYFYTGAQNGPDTIVFDIIATGSGDELYDADPVIAYNTDAFGTYAATNSIATCTTTLENSDYTFILADYNSGAFQVHLDAVEPQYSYDVFNNPDSIWGVVYQIIATCKLTVENYCSGAHLSVNRVSSGYYAELDYTDSTNFPTRFAVGLGAGIDTASLTGYIATTSINSIYPTTITAGTFDTLTINGIGFGCTPGVVQFTNVQGGWVTARSPDIVSWSDNQVRVIVASCQTGYGDNLTPGTGPVQILAFTQSTPSSILTIPYAVINNRLSSGRAIRVGLWGVDAGSVIPHNEYTFTPDVSITNNSPALTTITQAMSDWVCETGVRFIMGTPVNYNLTQNDSDFTNSIFFGSVSGEITGAACFITPSPPCANSNGDTVEVIVDEDYIFDGTLLQQYLSYPWFLGDTSAFPDTIAPNLGYISLLGAARHEFGHGMGLQHVLNPIDLMYPSNPPNVCKVIHYDDQQGGLYELINTGSYLRPCYTPNPQYQSLMVCTASTSGIRTIEGTINIHVYPNPFDQTITIQADIGSPDEIKIELLSIIGQIVVSDDYGIISDSYFRKTISTAGLNSGIYFAKVSINGSAMVFKLVKD